MKWFAISTVVLGLILLSVSACGPGRGPWGRNRRPHLQTPLVFKQHEPNVPEYTLSASGGIVGRISRNDSRFRDLEFLDNPDIIFKDEEGTGADRLMTERCKEKLYTLAISVMNQWPTKKLLVFDAWDEDYIHGQESLHYEGRAVDVAVSDKDRLKLGMLARLAVEAGFDWVFYESRSYIHCSVKLESSDATQYGGCFTGDGTVLTSSGTRKPLSQLLIGEKILAHDQNANKLVFSEVILFLDYNPSEKREFLMFYLKSGRNLTVTSNHLVLLHDNRTVYSGTLKIGDKLLVSSDDDNKNTIISEDIIEEIKIIYKKGVYAPLTKVGTVVVNDVVASCYATFDSQNVANWAFMPIRLIYNLKLGMKRIWLVLSKPINRWNEPQINEINSRQTPSVGVYWYAKFLYTVANYLIPGHLNNF